MVSRYRFPQRAATFALGIALAMSCGFRDAVATPQEVEQRSRIAAANMEDAVIIDCQLPGKLQKLGGMRTYLTPGRLVRLAAIDCRTRGGEYTLGDLASGTLSLARWLPLAEKGDAEAQYYVARIYANGMSGVTTDYAKAAEWYQKAVAQNYSSAQQELGYLYEQGLGVQQDAALALNLQRKAAGLGAELDYAWKIAAAREEGERQVAALSASLEQSNLELREVRAQLADSRDSVQTGRAELARAQDSLLDLRAQLDAARKAGASQDAGRVKQLESELATRQASLTSSQQQLERLESQLAERQSALAQSLAQSQSVSMQLNELQASGKEENRTLRAQLAQAEQRLITSQQELADQRAQFRRETERLAAERAQLERARAAASDGGAALLASKQRELDRQQITVQALQAELARARTAQNQSKQQGVESAQRALTDLQARYDVQLVQLQSQRQELAALATKSQQERAALMQQMSQQLLAKSGELQGRERRIASLENEAGLLRDEVARLEGQRSADTAKRGIENEGLRDALRAAQQTASDQRERLEQLQTESARERNGLLQAQGRLQQELAAGKEQSQREIAILQADIRQREITIKAKDEFIASLRQQIISQPMLAANVTLRSAPASAGAATVAGSAANSDGPRLLQFAQASDEVRSGHFYALVIGNNQYYHMSELATPGNDVRVIADVLEQRYKFKVQQLINATADKIMSTLWSYQQRMGEEDSLLVYFAGHGDIVRGTPERAYWLGVDADPNTRTGYIQVEAIKDQIKEMKAKHVLLVADSCFSGAITHATTTTVGRGINEQRFRIMWDRRARVVLTSGQVTPVVDSSGDRNHSLFAKYFIQILRQNDNLMSGEMLSHELSGRVLPEAMRMGIKQAPTYSTLRDANHNLGDFFFVPVPLQVAAL